MDTDVLVVGAGPTGLMLANQLGRRNVRTMIIDRHFAGHLSDREIDSVASSLRKVTHAHGAESCEPADVLRPGRATASA